MPSYRVMVDDNFHYRDESERYEAGEFATLEAAFACCREIVDRSLTEGLRPGVTADQLYATYIHFGEDPFVVVDDGAEPPPRFSAWDFARQRCEELCAGK